MAKAARPINESNRSLSQYLEEIGQFEPLHPSREVELAQAIKKGDRFAMKELVEANLRFVVSVAKDYQGQGLPLTDLISEGNMGLMKAAGRFDETRGFKFISYDNMLAIEENLTVGNFAYDVDLLLTMKKLNIELIDFPVTYIHNDDSSVRIIKDSFKMFVTILRLKRKYS